MLEQSLPPLFFGHHFLQQEEIRDGEFIIGYKHRFVNDSYIHKTKPNNMARKPFKQRVLRSSKTGRFVSAKFAAKHKATTKAETVKIKK